MTWIRTVLGTYRALAFGLALFGAAVFLFAARPSVAAGAPKPTVSPGVHIVETQYEGLTRYYRIDIPRSVDLNKKTPIVVFLHPGGGTMYGVMATGLAAETHRRGWLLVSPQGTRCGVAGDSGYCWNAVHCCGIGDRRDVDDVGFIEALLDEIDLTIPLDRSRIYAMGYSNGAMLTHRLASELPTTFAAIGEAAGTIGGAENADAPIRTIPEPSAPVPIVMLHGELDDHVSFDGGVGVHSHGRFDVSFDESQKFWASANGCADRPHVRTRDLGSDDSGNDFGLVTIREYRRCSDRADVVGITFSNLGHGYPKEDNTGVDTAKYIVGFFARHSR